MGATFPLVAGFVARRARDVGRDVGRLYAGNTMGGIADPNTAWMLMRSLETLELRMSRAGENAAKVCAFLRDHPKVESIGYLGFLTDGRQADIYRLYPGAKHFAQNDVILVPFPTVGGELPGDTELIAIDRASLIEVVRRHPAIAVGLLRGVAYGNLYLTEKQGGSDVGAIETRATYDEDEGCWRLYGEKWFCSNVDAEGTLVLARTEGAPAGTAGLSMFLVPHSNAGPGDGPVTKGDRRERGPLGPDEVNDQRYRRLKDKLGTVSVPTGEVEFDGARGFLVGEEERGFAQMAPSGSPWAGIAWGARRLAWAAAGCGVRPGLRGRVFEPYAAGGAGCVGGARGVAGGLHRAALGGRGLPHLAGHWGAAQPRWRGAAGGRG